MGHDNGGLQQHPLPTSSLRRQRPATRLIAAGVLLKDLLETGPQSPMASFEGGKLLEQPNGLLAVESRLAWRDGGEGAANQVS
jgi:hypothetical protein